MHELGIMIEIVDQVTKIAQDEGVKRVDKLVLEVGEVSMVIPHYLEACYPAAVHETILQDTELVIEMIKARCRCRECYAVYPAKENDGVCTNCGKKNFDLLSGAEFNIKEIVVEDD